TLAAWIVGCGGGKKPKVMTDMPNTGGDSKMGTGGASSSVPPAPPPTAVSNNDAKQPSAKDKKGPKSVKPTGPADASDKKPSEAKKIPPGAVEDDGGYENCKDMSPDELKKALI
ncbi:hypothetical protein PRIPAC_87368, partial [Pristionchus pacificus]